MRTNIKVGPRVVVTNIFSEISKLQIIFQFFVSISSHMTGVGWAVSPGLPTWGTVDETRK